MRVDSLVLEVGRKCNMHCDHCLRGECEDVEMSFETAKAAIDAVDEINNITFTGGEPFLYADLIIRIAGYLIETKKTVLGFYVVTNGKIINWDLLTMLIKLYAYCVDIADEFYGGLVLSVDEYHEDIDDSNKAILSAFKFSDTRSLGSIIDEGRAAENGLGEQRRLSTEFSVYDDCVEMLYVNAKGYIIPDCDYSFESQKDFEKYIVGERPLEQLIKAFNEEKAA